MLIPIEFHTSIHRNTHAHVNVHTHTNSFHVKGIGFPSKEEIIDIKLSKLN